MESFRYMAILQRLLLEETKMWIEKVLTVPIFGILELVKILVKT